MTETAGKKDISAVGSSGEKTQQEKSNSIEMSRQSQMERNPK